LLTAAGVRASRAAQPLPYGTALDAVAAGRAFVAGLPLGQRPAFVRDAQAAAVYHGRRGQARGFLCLGRGDEGRQGRRGGPAGAARRRPAVAARRREPKACRRARQGAYPGRSVGPYVAAAAVGLDRRAWRHRAVGGRRQRRAVPGLPLPLRRVVTELRDQDGRGLPRGSLLTHVPAAVQAATLALGSGGRWPIETSPKLRKAAGQQGGHGPPEDGRALFKRLQGAGRACVLAWRRGASRGRQALEARRVVLRRSGRQRAHGTAYTPEGLRAGIGVLLARVAALAWLAAGRRQPGAAFVRNASATPAPAKGRRQRAAG
jgi:hypothetical protein